MKPNELREKHPYLSYDSYAYHIKNKELWCEFHYTLAPDIHFSPTIRIPLVEKAPHTQDLDVFVFNLGIMEGVNYWKSAVSPQYIIKAGHLTPEQTVWWHTLIIESLGEFYYTNNIDFRPSDFLTVTSQSDKVIALSESADYQGNLILSSGGKDSAVTLEILKNVQENQATFTQIINNPERAPTDAGNAAGYPHAFKAYKEIDTTLLQISRQGYLTGHMPFSAMVAFLSLLIAHVFGYKNIIASNEIGANEGNLPYLDKIINHQYAKSIVFEKMFREYIATYINKELNYFSILRPLNELQIAWLFSQYPRHHLIFRSCNRNLKLDSWCGECAKCAFIYLVLAPFLSQNQLQQIFGGDLFQNPAIQQHIRDLVGLGNFKPLECVGTPAESKIAVFLTLKKFGKDVLPLPVFLEQLRDNLNLNMDNDTNEIAHALRQLHKTEHFIPNDYIPLLIKALQEAHL